MNNKELALHLIGEQIRNMVYITALENLGFDCSMYTLNISEVILSLVGYNEKPDSLYQRYFEMIEKAVDDTNYCNMDEKLKEWSETIYSELINEKLDSS